MSPVCEINAKCSSLQLTNRTCSFYVSFHLNSLIKSQEEIKTYLQVHEVPNSDYCYMRVNAALTVYTQLFSRLLLNVFKNFQIKTKVEIWVVLFSICVLYNNKQVHQATQQADNNYRQSIVNRYQTADNNKNKKQKNLIWNRHKLRSDLYSADLDALFYICKTIWPQSHLGSFSQTASENQNFHLKSY